MTDYGYPLSSFMKGNISLKMFHQLTTKQVAQSEHLIYSIKIV